MIQISPDPAKGFQGKVSWPLVRMSEVVSLHYGRALVASSRMPGCVRVFGSNGQCGWHNKPLGNGPTVILGRKGQGPLGVEWCPWPFWVIDTAYYVKVNAQRINIRYFYFLTKFIGLNHLKDGTSNPSLSRDVFGQQGVPLPPIPSQHRIASILSDFDELIENNERRIKILESMARALYREWFVHFRFPGHEHQPRVISPFGEIPQGWEVKKLKDVCRLTMGQSPKSEFYNETGKGLPFHQGVTNFGDRFPSDKLFCTAEGRIAEAGDILFSVRAPVGRMNIANKKIILGRGLSAIQHHEGHQAFLWEQLRNRFTKDDMMGNGAIFASVTKDDMQGIELLCPPSSVVAAATTHFEPLHSEVATLSRQIQNLRCTRDILLPRLLSGQINFESADVRGAMPL